MHLKLPPIACSLSLLLLAVACSSPMRPPLSPPVVSLSPRTIADTAVLVARPYDASQHEATCKVYHEIHAPDGRILTKGEGGEFPHHRGLFVGWNQTRWRDRSFDFWHLNHGESQRFVAARPAAQLDLPEAAEVSEISWQSKADEPIVRELRGLSVRREGAVHYLHLRIRLEAVDAPVELRGDPQHAGQQFRALQQFAEKDAVKVHYLRPATATPHDNDVWTDCEWIAQVLPLHDDQGLPRPVTVLRIEGSANPGEATWSTRDYGRFGAMRVLHLQPGQPLTLDYNYVLAMGERDLAWCEQQVTALRTSRERP